MSEIFREFIGRADVRKNATLSTHLEKDGYMGVSLNGGTPNLHPKMTISSRKTHDCWVPPFWETPIGNGWNDREQGSGLCLSQSSVFVQFICHYLKTFIDPGVTQKKPEILSAELLSWVVKKQKWFSRSDSTPNDFRRIPWGVPQLVGIPNSHQSTMMQFNTWTTQPSQLSNKNHSSSTKKSHVGPQSPPLLLELRDFEFVAKVIITHHAQGISKMTQPLGGMSV